MRKVWIIVFVVSLLSASDGFSAELGRRAVEIPTPVQKAYQGILSEGNMGFEVDLTWNTADWDVGSESYHDKVWMPELSLYYGINDFMDVRLCSKYLSLKDDTIDLDIVRVGIGTKAWIPTKSDFTPYVDLLINYYNLGSDRINDIEGTFGISGGAGVSYLLTDTFLIRVGLHGEIFLTDAKGSVDGSDKNISFSALGIGLGATVLF